MANNLLDMVAAVVAEWHSMRKTGAVTVRMTFLRGGIRNTEVQVVSKPQVLRPDLGLGSASDGTGTTPPYQRIADSSQSSE